jgi:hypothetical protein
MLKEITDWLLRQGILFATLLINLLSAGITVLLYLIIALAVSWWNKNT